MCKPFFTIVLLSGLTLAAQAQPDDDVRAVVDRFFDGMRAGDSTVVRSVLHPEARFLTTMTRDGIPMLHIGSVDAFLDAVGSPHEEVWDERIWNVNIHVDDRLAAAWMDYAFFLDDEFSHCGVNAFQLFHDSDGWKVVQITDTRRREGCDIPDEK